MYHDQVLTPIKTIFEYNAFNLTMGSLYVCLLIMDQTLMLGKINLILKA